MTRLEQEFRRISFIGENAYKACLVEHRKCKVEGVDVGPLEFNHPEHCFFEIRLDAKR